MTTAGLCALVGVAALVGCATTGVQGIETNLDDIQAQLFQVQKENAELAEKIAALRETALESSAGSGQGISPEVNVRLEALEDELTALGIRHQQTDQRLAALVQDLRGTREALQALLLSSQERAARDPGGIPPTGMARDPALAGDPDDPATAARLVPIPAVAADPAEAGSGLALEDLYRQGYSDYTKGNYALALLELEEFANRYPASDLADDARYFIGEVYYSQEAYPEAVESFDRVVQAYPDGDKAGAAYLKKGLALLEMNRTADAVIQLQHVITAFPSSEEARIARHRLKSLGLSER